KAGGGGRAWPARARGPSPGKGMGQGGRRGRGARGPAAAAGLAAAAPDPAARAAAAGAGGRRAHRDRLVGRRRRAPRLPPRAPVHRPAGVGVPARAGGGRLVAARVVRMNAGYAELHCLSNFSFQRGASSARELCDRAKQHGYQALAITDECTLAGIVRAWQAAKEVGLPLVTGSEMQVEGGPKLVLLAEDLAGYQALCRIITAARMRAGKGEYRLLREDLEAGVDGLLALWVPDEPAENTPVGRSSDAEADWLQALFPGRLWIAVELHREAGDAAKLARLQALGRRLGVPLVAAGDVHMHARGRRALQDVMTAIRHHVTVAEAGWRLFPNGERHLRPLPALAGLYPPELLEESLRIARRCRFDLGQLRYQYPHELGPGRPTAASGLRQLTEEGLRRRWAGGVPAEVRNLVEKELALIAGLGYESYCLPVHDIVRFARSRDILCQGRGSAANSVVC